MRMMILFLSAAILLCSATVPAQAKGAAMVVVAVSAEAAVAMAAAMAEAAMAVTAMAVAMVMAAMAVWDTATRRLIKSAQVIRGGRMAGAMASGTDSAQGYGFFATGSVGFAGAFVSIRASATGTGRSPASGIVTPVGYRRSGSCPIRHRASFQSARARPPDYCGGGYCQFQGLRLQRYGGRDNHSHPSARGRQQYPGPCEIRRAPLDCARGLVPHPPVRESCLPSRNCLPS